MRASPTIACMVLYRNERVHLERIVPKILQTFDQAIFVTNLEPNDDGSDELLARYGVVPHRMKWVEDFSVARQFGLDASTCDYTMWMDCDDDLVTGCGSWSEARDEVKEFLRSSAMNFYMHRIWHEDRADYWDRENWFRRDSNVKVKYPTHEVYLVEGQGGEFPPGLIDRVNDPLKPDYSGKLWRYFDMLHAYVRDVDPRDARCRFYLAREFTGPPRAHVALYLDYFRASRRPEMPLVFSDECWASFNLFDLRDHVDRQVLFDNARHLVERYPFEFMAHVLWSMTRCELTPSDEEALRFAGLMDRRGEYDRDKSPFTRGWYFDKALNCAGYYAWRAALASGNQQVAGRALELLTEVDRPGCDAEIAELAQANRRAAELLIRGPRQAVQ